MTQSTTPTTARPFKVLGIQQIAIGGTDKQRMKTLWVDMLGLEQTGTFQSERENVDEDILAMGKGAAGYDITFLHPKSNEQFPIAGEGVLIELVQAPPEVIAALG